MKLLNQVQSVCLALEEAGVHMGQGTLDPWDEAAWLVLWALGLPLDTRLEAPPEEPNAPANQPLSPSQLMSIQNALAQRIQLRKPMAYIAQEAWLQGVAFYVDERALIPRSLIAEVLASQSLQPWMPSPPKRIWDLCTGNGSLALLGAMAWPNASVMGSDISESALEVARINALRHGLDSRLEWRVSDGLEAFPSPPQPERFDLVLCNPPYVPTMSMNALPLEFKAEPSIALAGGEDGMDFIQSVLPRLAHYLSEQGLLVLEIGHEIEAFMRCFQGLPFVSLSTQETEDQVLLLFQTELNAYFLR
jgi:ribosomal protein L3 glutamine methyltransferase